MNAEPRPEETQPANATRDVGFRAIKRKQKAKAGRGFESPMDVIDCMKGDWD